MSKRLIDTTVLTDARLKSGERARKARDAIAAGTPSLLPAYAIKEFKSGPLANFVLVYNKAATVTAFDELYRWVASLRGSPHRMGTALEALESATAGQSTIALSAIRRELETRIVRAWRDRRKGTEPLVPLACYRGEDEDVRVAVDGTTGLIDVAERSCSKEGTCALAVRFEAEKGSVRVLLDAIEPDRKPESSKRAKALRVLLEDEGVANFGRDDCRALGDAVFALICPTDAKILTTNVRDHEPLAAALGRSVIEP